MADEWNMPEGELMKGKRGIVMGVANQNSIAWGISKQLAAQGAEIAFTYQDAFESRVRPLGMNAPRAPAGRVHRHGFHDPG